MKKSLQALAIFATVLSSPTLLHTQADKGISLLDKGNPAAAEAAFRTEMDDPKNGPLALYGLARVFSDAQFERRQVDTAFAYIEACDRAYRKMPPNLKSKIFKKLSSGMISDQRKKIMDQASVRAKEQGTVEAWDFFLNNFPKPAAALKRNALRERNALLAVRAEQSDNWRDVKDILDRYGPSLAGDTPPLFTKAQEALFRTWTSENGFRAFPEFQAAFPDNAVSKDTLKTILDQALRSSDPQALAAFTEKHTQSIFLPFAVDSLAERLAQGGTEALHSRFLAKYPNHSRANAVRQRHYAGVRENTTDPARLEQFLRDNPAFPFPEQVAQDIAYLKQNQERLEYETFAQKPEVSAGFAFLSRFPESSRVEQVKQRMADLLAQPDARKRDIEQFLEDYPLPGRRQALLNRLYDFVSQKADIGEIMAFEKNYPDFEGKKRIAADKERADWSRLDPGAFSEEKRPLFEEYIRRTAPSGKALAALRKMIDPDYLSGNYAAAATVANAFNDAFGNADEDYNQLKSLLALAGEDIKRQSFAPNINSTRDDYAPILSADGRTLYLCRNSSGSEDIYVSYQDPMGNWSAPVSVSVWNTSYNSEAPESISADGNTFFLFRGGKFYLSKKTADGWSAPEMLASPFNKFSWQADLSIAADGKAMLFAARTPGGSVDLYVSLLKIDETWGEPFSLGNAVNTPREDRSPFLHPDGKTLYFSSEGHEGFGGSDIFMTKRLDDTWTNWSAPLNLGPAINSKGNDWGFRVSTNGQFAYYTAIMNGNQDIVRCNLPSHIRPEEVATITAKMVDIDGKPLDAEIVWEDLETGEVVQVTRSNPATGEFFAVLPERKRYGYSVRKPGYFPLSGNVDLRGELSEIKLDKPMELATFEEMKTRDLSLPLNNLFFETAKFNIQPESFPELNRLARLIISEKLSIEIHGHTDSVGSDASNQALSENRARAVRDYLIGKGCDSDLVSARGFGKSRPKASNDTEEGRALNRRVEIKIRG